MLGYQQFYRIRHLQQVVRTFDRLCAPHAGLIAVYPDLALLVVLDILLRSRGYLNARDRSVLELVVEVFYHPKQRLLCDVILYHAITPRSSG